MLDPVLSWLIFALNIALYLIFIARVLYRVATDTSTLEQLPHALHNLSPAIFLRLGSWAKIYGPIFQVQAGKKSHIFINTVDHIKQTWIEHRFDLVPSLSEHAAFPIVTSAHGMRLRTGGSNK
ncbi:MAG: hypothetical protein Q9221_004266 [Calogaya cf. arnoldii]